MTSKINDSENSCKKLYIKYMVCLRDKLLVKAELNQLGLMYRISDYGAIVFLDGITTAQQNELKKRLLKPGMVLLDKAESGVIDRIIDTIIETIHGSDKLPKLSFTDIISEHSKLRNESVLKIFSDVQGMSIIQFIVIQKVERVKELLLYEDRTLSEITDILQYENTDLLIAQFKKHTGLTPDYYMRMKRERLKISSQSSDPSVLKKSSGKKA